MTEPARDLPLVRPAESIPHDPFEGPDRGPYEVTEQATALSFHVPVEDTQSDNGRSIRDHPPHHCGVCSILILYYSSIIVSIHIEIIDFKHSDFRV
jgi:hypothetical protein